MDLSNLKPAAGSTKDRKRIARGVGSGYGGHSSTRGNKGQKAESGAVIPSWFEGGQMPLQRRLPKFGFKNRFRVEYKAVNLGEIERLIAAGKLDATKPIGNAQLMKAGLVGKKELVKVLGDGKLTSAITIKADKFSASAIAKIEAAGGKAETL